MSEVATESEAAAGSSEPDRIEQPTTINQDADDNARSGDSETSKSEEAAETVGGGGGGEADNGDENKQIVEIVAPEIKVQAETAMTPPSVPSSSNELSNTLNALDLAANSTATAASDNNNSSVNSNIDPTNNTQNLETLKNQNHNASGTSLNSNDAGQSSSYEHELSRLREIIREKENALGQMESRLNEVETTARAHAEQLNQQFSAKLEESVRTLKESSQRDKNSMVMKYVEGERRCIELNRSIELLNGKLADANRERQRLNERLSAAKLDADKMNAENDKKLKEIMSQKKEMDRLRDQLVLSEAREKAAQMKLAKDAEASASVARQLELANAELAKLKQVEITSEEVQRLQTMEQERKQQEISLNKYKETLQSQKQMNKDLLDEILQLRESKETWEREQKEKRELEAKLAMTMSDLSELQTEMKLSQEKQNELLAFTAKLTEKNTQLQSENTSMREKLQQVESDLAESSRGLVESNQSLKAEVKSLKETLSEKLQQLASMERELSQAQKTSEELSSRLADERNEMATLKKKHAANLKDLTRQIQAFEKRATTASSLGSVAAATPQGSQSLTETSSGVGSSSAAAAAAAERSRMSREDSISSLSNEREFTEHQQQLQHMASAGFGHHNYETDDLHSLESSASLSMMSNSSNHHHHRFQHEVSCDGGLAAAARVGGVGADDVYVFDIDKQKLIEKIVRLQKKLAKSNEKIDFLQDHVNQLTEDLKRKTRIIQAYAIKEDTGAFTSDAHDAIKREMSKKTGIMSTLYNTNKSYVQTANFIKLNESNMTMELCLEINAKLQALLEDTLIKNITLKESLETLGTEIARLSKENRQIQLNHH